MRIVLALLLLSSLAASAKADDGLRCGNLLVTAGANQDEVATKCGPPTQTSRRVEKIRRLNRTYRATYDTWTYDRGPRDFVRILTFEDGVLKNVEVGDYGK